MIKAGSKKVYLPEDLIGAEILIDIETRYGRENNSTSIYFYDVDGKKIDGIGTYFYIAGGTTTNATYSYTIPQNCGYIEFWSGDGSYGPFLKICNITIE